MNFPDDPKLTAYALGEMDNAEDRAAVEALLREHPEVAAELEETRALAAILRRELRAEEGAPLRDEQRAEVLAMAQRAEQDIRVGARSAARFPREWVLPAMAACLAVTLGVALLFPSIQGARESARAARQRAAGVGDASELVPGRIASIPAAPSAPAPTPSATIATATEGANFDASASAPATPALAQAEPPSSRRSARENAGAVSAGRVGEETVVTTGGAPAAPSEIMPEAETHLARLEAAKAPARPALVPATEADDAAQSAADASVAAIREQIAPAEPRGWASQPGAIRPYRSADGKAAAGAKVYPAEPMQPGGPQAAQHTAEVALTQGTAPAPAAAPVATAPSPATASKPARAKVAQLSTEAEGFYNAGRLDLAYKRAEQVLGEDPHNIAARRLQEDIDRRKGDGAADGNNHTRAFSVSQVEKAWNRPVRRSPNAENPAPDGSASAAAPASPAAPQPSQSVAFVGGAEQQLDIYGAYVDSTSPSEFAGSGPADAEGRVISLADDWQRKDFAMQVVPAPKLSKESAARGGIVTPPANRDYRLRIVPQETEALAKNFGVFPPAEASVTLESEVSDAGAKQKLEEVQRNVEQQVKPFEVLRQQVEPSNTESYDAVTDNPFLPARDNPLSTFSIDVDTASYANVRRFLTSGQRPPKGAVRIEELINYFRYDYPQPQDDDPFSCTMEVAAAPWQPAHRLVRVGLKGREIAKEKRPPSNLVFLLDVSGSMEPANRLPLVKECMKQLVNELGENDTVAIAVYAGASGTVLEPTSNKEAVRTALERLSAGGSTNGAAGIRLAYEMAQRAFKKGGNNRVILCTDGDFNVGVTSQSELVDLVAEKAKTGVFLSVLGFGMGNLKDSTMEKLADKGNGNYAYIDSLKEGRKVLVEEMSGTLFTIAKDVKIQVDWNPAQVGAYRLIGYENRLLAKEDFNDDKKDAGEIGAGHTVTALYEVIPAGLPLPLPAVDASRYETTSAALAAGASAAGVPALSKPAAADATDVSKEMLWLKLRFKAPDGDTSTLRTFPLTDTGAGWERSTPDFRWAAAVASFGMLLRDSPHKGNATWDSTLELAMEGKGNDPAEHRKEFLELVRRAKELVPFGAAAATTASAVARRQPLSVAAKLMLPEFSATDSPLPEVIDALAKKSREVDPEKRGVQVVYAGPSSGSQARLTLRLHNVSVADAARSIASAANATLSEEGDTLILRGK